MGRYGEVNGLDGAPKQQPPRVAEAAAAPKPADGPDGHKDARGEKEQGRAFARYRVKSERPKPAAEAKQRQGTVRAQRHSDERQGGVQEAPGTAGKASVLPFGGDIGALKRHPHPPPLASLGAMLPGRRVGAQKPYKKQSAEGPGDAGCAFPAERPKGTTRGEPDGCGGTAPVEDASSRQTRFPSKAPSPPTHCAASQQEAPSLQCGLGNADAGRNELDQGDAADASLDDAVKHRLHSTWSLYMLHDAGKRNEESWKDNQIMVFQFSTVEDFWCMIYHIRPPSRIGVSDYSLFRRGITPAWEDPSVCEGGRWVAKFPQKLESLNVIWLHTAMAAIGETLCEDHSEAISGIVVSVRPRFVKLALWVAVRDPQVVDLVGTKFKNLLGEFLDKKDATETEVSFQSFKDNYDIKLSLAVTGAE